MHKPHLLRSFEIYGRHRRLALVTRRREKQYKRLRHSESAGRQTLATHRYRLFTLLQDFPSCVTVWLGRPEKLAAKDAGRNPSAFLTRKSVRRRFASTPNGKARRHCHGRSW